MFFVNISAWARIHPQEHETNLKMLFYSVCLAVDLKHMLSVYNVSSIVIGKTLRRDLSGTPHHRNPLESITKGFYWRPSQSESFGKSCEEIILESLTVGILWEASQRDPIGKPQNWNPLGNAAKRSYWKASLSESSGKDQFSSSFRVGSSSSSSWPSHSARGDSCQARGWETIVKDTCFRSESQQPL